jgi:hypothetical protein
MEFAYNALTMHHRPVYRFGPDDLSNCCIVSTPANEGAAE